MIHSGKKGFELQFHWIFVLIAGALILAFFFNIAYKQKDVSQQKLQLTLATDVENIFTGAILSKETAQTLPVPPQGIAFECTETCTCRFRIDKATKDFGDKAIFAPILLKDQELIVWTVALKLPYRATNLLYITNPNIKYYFVHDETKKQLFEEITKTIPPLIQYETITPSQMPGIKEQDYHHTKFILFETDPRTLDNSFRKASASAIKIDQNGITFYEKSGTELRTVKKLGYAGLPSIYAAIFAEDATMYECGLRTAFRKLSYISQIYAERAAELEQKSTEAGMTWCVYGAGTTTVCEGATSIIGLLCEQQKSSEELATKGLDNSLIVKITNLKTQLDSMNRNYLQQSCPEIF